MFDFQNPERRCRGVVWSSGPKAWGPLTDSLGIGGKAILVRGSHLLDADPWVGEGPFWRKLADDATTAGVGFGMLEGACLVNAGCGRADLLSAILFASERKVGHYILSDIDLPSGEKIGNLMDMVPPQAMTGMAVSFIELDMDDLFRTLSVKASVVMNLMTGPEIVFGSGGGFAATAGALSEIVGPGGIFFGHSSAPIIHMGDACWDIRHATSSFFAIRR